MDTLYKVYLKGISEELAGYEKITPAIVRKKLLSYALNLQIKERSCRLKLGQECGFCQVSIRPEIYISAGENLRQIHGKKGFCFKGLIAYDIGGEWLTDTEKEYLVIYEPFSEELYVVPLKLVITEKVNPCYKFWNKVTTKMYFVKAQDGVSLYRQFWVRGNSLVASDDILMSQSHDAGAHHYYYFAPMSFVYHPLWTAKELADKPLEELKKLTK